mmetsp:Transcript_113757/g.309067  ORF Transcript_113757/g.309067 Transcript_113757/m.309067 type:complete len:227 (-) Transcript_113757:12-692(-)
MSTSFRESAVGRSRRTGQRETLFGGGELRRCTGPATSFPFTAPRSSEEPRQLNATVVRASAQCRSNIVDVDPSRFVKLHAILAELVHYVRLIDLDGVWQFAVRLQVSSLVGCVPHDDVALLVLEIPQRYQHNVSLVDPHFFPHLPSDVAQALSAVEATHLATPIAKHAQYLPILLAVLLELEFLLHLLRISLGALGFVTSKLVLGHRCDTRQSAIGPPANVTPLST